MENTRDNSAQQQKLDYLLQQAERLTDFVTSEDFIKESYIKKNRYNEEYIELHVYRFQKIIRIFRIIQSQLPLTREEKRANQERTFNFLRESSSYAGRKFNRNKVSYTKRVIS